MAIACNTSPSLALKPVVMQNKRKGRPIPMNDIWIAAQCLQKGWILVTDDTDFDYVDGLVLEHW
jgi:predicted nucleic acid-binding protein